MIRDSPARLEAVRAHTHHVGVITMAFEFDRSNDGTEADLTAQTFGKPS
jgi:hypothetical protein